MLQPTTSSFSPSASAAETETVGTTMLHSIEEELPTYGGGIDHDDFAATATVTTTATEYFQNLRYCLNLNNRAVEVAQRDETKALPLLLDALNKLMLPMQLLGTNEFQSMLSRFALDDGKRRSSSSSCPATEFQLESVPFFHNNNPSGIQSHCPLQQQQGHRRCSNDNMNNNGIPQQHRPNDDHHEFLNRSRGNYTYQSPHNTFNLFDRLLVLHPLPSGDEKNGDGDSNMDYSCGHNNNNNDTKSQDCNDEYLGSSSNARSRQLEYQLRCTSILLYNTGLCYHRLGLRRGYEAHLHVAYDLYSQCLETSKLTYPQHLSSSSSSNNNNRTIPSLLYLAVLNNLGHLSSHHCNAAEAMAYQNCIRLILEDSKRRQLFVMNKPTHVLDFAFFFLSVSWPATFTNSPAA